MVALFNIGRFHGTKSTTQKIMSICEELYYSNNNGCIIYKCSMKCFYSHTFIFKLCFFILLKLPDHYLLHFVSSSC